jgi:hypothetical protein
MEGSQREAKPLCASVEGFSLHAAQSVAAEDREALERLLRYGLRAPFSQERLSLHPDGKVIYRLRRPWPRAGGATHLLLEPLDFLRRLAALVSFPYSHQVRYHGVFAGRSRFRKLLPPPPSREAADLEEPPARLPDAGDSVDGEPTEPLPSRVQRRRVPWAQLLRRVLHVDALACPRCSRPEQSVPMVVLAFLTDPEVVGKILRHLGLPASAPVLAPAVPVGCGQPVVEQMEAFAAQDLECAPTDGSKASDGGRGEGGASSSTASPPAIRPPP